MFDQKYRPLSRLVPIAILVCLISISLKPFQPAAADTLAAGLRGEYFDNEDFTNLKLTRTDTTVDFNWGFSAPDPAINSENFSIRWTGQIIAPATGNFVFVTQSDDGVRLWLGNQLLIDNLTPHPLTEDRSVAVALTSGQSYNLRLEYFELTANAVIRLMWIRPGQSAPEIIPSTNLATPVTPNAAPILASLSPSIIQLGSQNMTLTVNGSNFLQGASVQFNNATRTTNFLSSTQVTATLTAADLAFAHQAKITVVNPLPGGGTSNPLTLVISGGFEADVAPRPNGTNNGTITIADWTQLGRFSAGLDTVNNGNEYQRADCAPRSTLGDGRITLTDWVQAGRYATALDPVTGAGGPTAPATSFAQAWEQHEKPARESWEPGFLRIWAEGIESQNWIYRHPPTTNHQTIIYAVAQSPNSVAIFCEGSGLENAIALSMRFNADQWEFLSSSSGSGARNPTLWINANWASAGLVGVLMALPPSQKLDAKNRPLAVLTFRNRLGNILPAFSPMALEFADQPIACEVSSVRAESLPSMYVSSFQRPLNSRLPVAQPRKR